uniref:NADH-ubiquinone oxidoreductase chain 5 n=1 Tax=Thorea hispida TaxID=202687 RepID=A0A1Z1XAX6_9FLOR|nr:NADH dehydrogenase subunit 5 [Thorea hispida]ARX95978.1 NADH dehydrogenase subunit 5 [Thorea hispida]
MYLLIIVLPLFSSLFSGLGGRWIGSYGSCLVSCSCLILTTFLSVFAVYEVGFSGSSCYFILMPWIESGTLKMNWGFLFDTLTVVMLVIITAISSLVHIYSINYMENDPHIPRFMSYLSLFTFFMLILVSADNLVQMFLGWEGVGLASYLLINFWYTRLNANQSAIKALLINRIGDYSLSLSIVSIFFLFKSVDYGIIFSCTPFFLSQAVYFLGFEIHSLTWITLLLFVGAVGKSAQLGLHTWLPDAMEGPTPVSALIHAATMVTAGIFLMIRFSHVVEYSPLCLFVLTIVGALTALFGAITGVFQNDLKKVIAYSTCSQLGYMMVACGLSCYNVSMFHLFNHAFFKALLFLTAGSIIHAIFDEQDMRRMGSLIKFLPLTYSLMLVGSFTLLGFPFLTGFYSKDFIIELSWLTTYKNLYLSYGLFSCWLINLAIFFSSFYSFRLLYLVFINNANLSKVVVKNIAESSTSMLLPLVFLAICSIFMGYLTKDLFIGFGSSFWGASIFILTEHSNFIEAEWTLLTKKWLPFFLTLCGALTAYFSNRFSNKISVKWLHPFIFFFNKKWYWDKLFNNFILIPLAVNISYESLLKTLDKGLVELSGPYIVPKYILDWSNLLIRFQTGQITHYVFFIIFGVFLFCVFILNPSFYLVGIFDSYLSVVCLLLLLFL